MKTPKKIRRFWLWVGIILLVELAAITLWKRWYWFFPTGQVSEVYAKYAGTDGINVAFFKDYRINDTVSVDATLLEAKDSVAWNTLKKDFKVFDPSLRMQRYIDQGKDLIYTKKIPKATVADTLQDSYPNVFSLSREDESLYSSRGTENVTYGNDCLAISHLNHTIIVFHTRNDDEARAVLYRNIDKSNNQ